MKGWLPSTAQTYMHEDEMGVLVQRGEDAQRYKDANEEAQRIIRISDEVWSQPRRTATSLRMVRGTR